jgi:hypothetical protein
MGAARYSSFVPPDDPEQEQAPPPPEPFGQPEKMRGGDPGAAKGAGKVPQSEAMYRGPEDRCEECVNFTEPNGCTKVDGVIDADGWCKLCQASAAEQNSPDEGDEGEAEPSAPASPAPSPKGQMFE